MMMSQQNYLNARKLLLEVMPKIEWGDTSNENFYGIAQDIFYGFGNDGVLGWYRVTTDCHPQLIIELMGESFDDAVTYALSLRVE